MSHHTGYSVYCRGFSHNLSNDEIRSLFENYGNVKKVFIDPNRKFGIIEFDELSACQNAIKELNDKPPLNLYVNMSRNQPNQKRDKEYSENSPPASSVRRSVDNSRDISLEKTDYDEVLIYLDKNNMEVQVLQEMNGTIYVPLSSCTCIRPMKKYIPKPIDPVEQQFQFYDANNMVDDFENFQYRRYRSRRQYYKGASKPADDDAKSTGSNHSVSKRLGLSNAPNKENDANHSINHSKFTSPLPSQPLRRPKFDTNDEVSHKNAFADTNNRRSNDDGQPTVLNKYFQQSQRSEVSDQSSQNRQKLQRERSRTDLNDYKSSRASISSSGDEFNPVRKSTPVNGHATVKATPKPVNLKRDVSSVDELVKQVAQTTINDSGRRLPKEEYTEVSTQKLQRERSHLDLDWDDFNPERKSRPVNRVATVKETPKPVNLKRDVSSVDELVKQVAQTTINDTGRRLPKEQYTEEHNITKVQVKEGIYGKAENWDDKNIDVLKKLRAKFFAKIQESDTGLMEFVALKENQLIGFAIPLGDLANIYSDLLAMEPENVPNFKPKIGELVASSTEEETWNRALILSIEGDGYKVAMIDYGTTEVVKEVKPLPKKYHTYPQFTFVIPSITGLIEIGSEFEFTIDKLTNETMTVTLQNEYGTVMNNVLAKPWHPLQPKINKKPEKLSVSFNNNIPEIVHSAPVIQKKEIVPEKLFLNSGEKVKVIEIHEQILFVRTQSSNKLLNKIITPFMEKYQKGGKLLTDTPEVADFVAADFEGAWYRARVCNINKNIANVFYIDYGSFTDKPIAALKSLDEAMLQQPYTIADIKLRNFLDNKFNQKQIDYLRTLINEEQVCQVSLDSFEDCGYDLTVVKKGTNVVEYLPKLVPETDRSTLVSTSKVIPLSSPEISKSIVREKTSRISESSVRSGASEPKVKPPAFPKLTPPADDQKTFELPVQSIPIGKTEIIYLGENELDTCGINVCMNKADILHKIQVELPAALIQYVKSLPEKVYIPESNEYVIAKGNGKWYRAICVEPSDDDEYLLFFVDYGFTKSVRSSDIRRLPIEAAKLEAIANFAEIDGIPKDPSQAVIDRIYGILEMKTIYQCEVLSINESDCYKIKIPLVTKTLKEEGLI